MNVLPSCSKKEKAIISYRFHKYGNVIIACRHLGFIASPYTSPNFPELLRQR